MFMAPPKLVHSDQVFFQTCSAGAMPREDRCSWRQPGTVTRGGLCAGDLLSPRHPQCAQTGWMYPIALLCGHTGPSLMDISEFTSGVGCVSRPIWTKLLSMRLTASIFVFSERAVWFDHVVVDLPTLFCRTMVVHQLDWSLPPEADGLGALSLVLALVG